MPNRPISPKEKTTRKLQFFDALLPRYQNCTPSSLSSTMLRNRARRYWPDGDVNSQVFLARYPDTKLLIRMARLAARRRIKYWHPWHMELTHSTYRLGKQIDWFTPPNGDHEWIDSLVRFTHMQDLAAAYRLTKKPQYLQAFDGYLTSFSEIRDQPGRHWKYRLNAAIRITNLIRAYDLIARTNTLSVDVHMAVHENLFADIRFLSASLGETCGNGAFFVATALLTAAEYLGDFFRVDEWSIPAEKHLYKSIGSELQPDGIEAEQVPMYHGQVVLVFLDYFVALMSNERPIDDLLKGTVTKMLDALCGLCDPQGYIPPIGDSDRFPISYLTRFHNAVLGVANSFDIGKSAEHAVSSKVAGTCQLATFEDTGWVVARWDYGQGTQGYLFFDCSGKPEDSHSYHSHADDLQFLLHTSNGPIFTDPGRFTYCKDFKAFLPFTRQRIYPESRFRPIYELLFPGFMDLKSRNWREYFQQTLSHNTVSMDGENQPQYSNHPEACGQVALCRSVSIGPLVLMEGCFDSRSPADCTGLPESSLVSGYQHQRTLIGYLPNLWIVIDRVRSAQQHKWISSYHMDTGCEVSAEQKYLVLTAGGEVHHLHFLTPQATEFDVTIERDWISRVYNKKQPAKTVRATIHNSSETDLVTVIHTHVDGATFISDIASVSATSDTGESTHEVYCVLLTSADSVTRLIINPEGRSLKFDGLEFDAVVVVESRVNGQLLESGFIGGHYLRSHDYILTSSQQEAGAFRSCDFSQL